MISGFETACKALGVKMVTKSPEKATVDGQITIVNELVAQGVKGIAIAANDATALQPTIEAATKAGIAVVSIRYDAAGSQVFVNPSGVKQVAQALVDSCYEMAGGEGQFAVLSVTSTAINPNAWIAAMHEIIDANPDKYGKLEWVSTVYDYDESLKSTDEMQNLMANYPNLEAVCCLSSVGTLAAAKAVANDPSCTIKVSGLGLPSWMKDYVGEGKPCPSVYMWNPFDEGSCAAYMIKALLDGKVGEVGTFFTADNGTTYEITDGDLAAKQIIVGPPFAFTGENIADWAEVY